MTDLSDSSKLVYKAKHKIRLVTAASLFDGHDASINIMRRLLQASGAEIVHLGHNRSVAEIVTAAIQEDAQAIGLSIHSGAHMTLFPRVVELLHREGADDVVVFGGGIIPHQDIPGLKQAGVAELFTPGTPISHIVDWVRENVPERPGRAPEVRPGRPPEARPTTT